MTTGFVIQKQACIPIENYQVEILVYLGQMTAGVHYFQVNTSLKSDSSEPSKLGLLRVGDTEGGLNRELQLRQNLKEYKMIDELLAYTTEESVVIDWRSLGLNQEQNESCNAPISDDRLNALADSAEIALDQAEQNCQTPTDEPDTAEKVTETEPEYLEEEYYPEEEMCLETGDRKLILLSYFPEEGSTLEAWLAGDNSLESSLSLTSQVCQFFRYIYQRGWCLIHILPKLIQMGTPIKFFDLTGAYEIGEQLRSGLLGNYCAPELAIGSQPVHESMSSYTVAALLYQSIHKQPLPHDNKFDINIQPIPRIYQLLKISLSPLPEERFSLSQLLSLLVETRQSFPSSKMQWNVASRSTVGLSTNRLQNEDNYGVRQLELSNSESLVLGVVADGMGGMSQGEIASKLAVQTVLEAPIPADFKTVEKRSEWLVSLVQKANDSVASNVRDGGTTLSIVLAVGRDLMIAHVGDSRIYLLKKEELRQLSEDHSLVAMLVASGQITYEESLDHPDRNVLTKSIGSKHRLSDGYVQQLSRSGQNLSLPLENGDILLLCSDGVWDLVSNEELTQFFTHNQTLQVAVDEVINCVLKRGAPDNATLLALELSCHSDKRY